MSKFKIYRLDDAKPKISRKKNRVLHIVFTIILLSLVTVFNVFNLLDLHYSIYIVVFVLLISFLIWLFLYLRKNTDRLDQIGILTISTKGIKETIRNLETKHNHSDIDQIKVEKHFPAILKLKCWSRL